MDEPCIAYSNYDHLTYWTEAQCTVGPPYLNVCSTVNGFPSGGTPANFIGFQHPADGVGYLSMTTYNLNLSNSTKFYPSVQLLEPLESGVEYCFSAYVSLAEQSAFKTTDLFMICTNDFPTVCSGNDTLNWPTESQLILNTTDVDTADWTLLTGSFIALGGEEYITIGDFNGPGTPDTIYVGATSFPSQQATYYIDKLELRSCEIGVQDVKESELTVLYDAAGDVLSITTPSAKQLHSIRLVDMAGRTALRTPGGGTSIQFGVADLPRGVYVVQVGTDGAWLNRKVVLY